MYRKVYLSRAQTKASAIDYPIGDPTGGAAYGEYNDPVSAAIAVGGNLISGSMSANAAESAANTTAGATRYASELQKQMFDIQNKQLEPYRGAGYTALSSLLGGTAGKVPQYNEKGELTGYATGTGEFTKPLTDISAYLDPSMAFRQQLGEEATRRQSNLAGGAIGGNTLRALQDYSQGLASTEYANAFNRAQADKSNIFNRLSSIAGIGQTAQQQSTGLAQNVAGNIGQLAIGGAQAQGAGQIGAANAWSGALGNVGNIAGTYGLLNRNPGGGSTISSLGSLGYSAPTDYLGSQRFNAFEAA